MFDRMLRDLNVVITPGSGFGSEGEGYIRISAFNSRLTPRSRTAAADPQPIGRLVTPELVRAM